MILSTASSKCSSSTDVQLFLTAIIAASFTMFYISAPENPGVKVASLFAKNYIVLFSVILIFFKYNSKIYSLSTNVGKLTSIILSNLPGLNKAGSSTSFLLVEAKTVT